MQYDAEVEINLKITANVRVEAEDTREAYSLAAIYAEEDAKDMLLFGDHEDTDVTDVIVVDSSVLGATLSISEDAYDR